MNFALTPDQEQIRDAIERVCAPFDADYWLRKDTEGGFPDDFHRALADSGWLGIAMPEEYGGAGMGVTEAAIMMQTIGSSAGVFAACSTVHINIFGLHSIVKHGSKQQKNEWLPKAISGELRACFGVTEPDAGLDTTKIKTRAVLNAAMA